jgi:hypothetical protein
VAADRMKSLFSPIPPGEDQKTRSSEESGVSTDRLSHGNSNDIQCQNRTGIFWGGLVVQAR